MPEEMRPSSPQQAPDPSNNYERSHPEREAGQGRLDNNRATPQPQADGTPAAVKNAQDPQRQINAQDTASPENEPLPGQGAAAKQPDHSMNDEEPLGWDQVPTGSRNTQAKRHPRPDGTGGTK